MKLRFTRRAVEDLEDIAEYVKVESPQGALNVRSVIYSALERALAFPRLGRPQKTEGVRKLVTPRFGYLVYYTIDAEYDEIIVLSVKHGAARREYEDR
jgi:addiction module RelE/StbE family toxin